MMLYVDWNVQINLIILFKSGRNEWITYYAYFIPFILELHLHLFHHTSSNCSLIQNNILAVSIALIAIFFILFLLYGMATYGLFHMKPGYENYMSAENKMGVDKICEYKQN